jgi:hypothetical protein
MNYTTFLKKALREKRRLLASGRASQGRRPGCAPAHRLNRRGASIPRCFISNPQERQCLALPVFFFFCDHTKSSDKSTVTTPKLNHSLYKLTKKMAGVLAQPRPRALAIYDPPCKNPVKDFCWWDLGGVCCLSVCLSVVQW